MKLTKIHIDAFGKLVNRDFSLGEGLNLLQGENESGKSTLCEFLAYLFYGADKPTREHYANWESGQLGGWCEIVFDGIGYRIRRAVTSKTEKVSVVEIETGESRFEKQVPGEVFLGIPKELFLKIGYVNQLRSDLPGEGLKNAVGNLLSSGAEDQDGADAVKRLEKLRRTLLHKNGKGGSLYEAKQALQEVSMALFQVTEEQARLSKKKDRLALVQSRQQELGASLAEQREQYRAVRICRKHRLILEKKKKDEEVNQSRLWLSLWREQHQKNGNLPQEDFVTALRQASERLDFSRERLEKSREQYRNAEAESANAAPLRRELEVCEQNGSESVIREKAGRLRRDIARYRKLGFLFLPIIPLAVLFFIKSAKSRKAYAELLEKLGGEPEAFLLRCGQNRIRLEQLETTVRICRQELSEAQDCYERVKAETEILLTRWNAGDVGQTLEAAFLFSEKEKSFCRELQQKENEAAYLAARLEGTDIESVESEYRNLPNGEEQQSVPSAVTEQSISAVQEESDMLLAEQTRLEKEIIQLRAKTEDSVELAEKKGRLELQIKEKEIQLGALNQAYDWLERASEQLRRDFTYPLSQKAGELMKAATDGKYPMLHVGQDFSLRFTEPLSERTHGVESFSAGTADSAYISLRLALLDRIAAVEPMPMIFDESFSRMDENRLLCALELLATEARQSGRQILILTSNGRDGQVLRQSGLAHVSLSMKRESEEP